MPHTHVCVFVCVCVGGGGVIVQFVVSLLCLMMGWLSEQHKLDEWQGESKVEAHIGSRLLRSTVLCLAAHKKVNRTVV
jgi:hypothetical protein